MGVQSATAHLWVCKVAPLCGPQPPRRARCAPLSRLGGSVIPERAVFGQSETRSPRSGTPTDELDHEQLVGVIRTFSDGDPEPDEDGSVARLKNCISERLPSDNLIHLSSSYNLELVRIICEQLLLLFQPTGPCVPKDASFDPLYVNNWFQRLVRKFDEEAPNKTLVILIDDLHRLNPLDSDIVAALSWLPINLPKNVHIVVTTVLSPDVLKLTPVQRERFRSNDCLYELPPVT
ncbi:unnamed protein product, partial [Nesidiocoris tenuis]